MKPNGYQILAEFSNCDSDALAKASELTLIIQTCVKDAGVQLIKLVSHPFEPTGVTAMAIISESHVALHTYPEAKQVSVDVFTCSSLEKSEKIVAALRKKLRPSKVKTITISRGNPMEVIEKDWMPSFSNYGVETSYEIKQHLYSGRSKYQQIDVIENKHFGRMLFLDRDLQISDHDCELYNKYMTEQVLARRPDRVAILGGGDGGILHTLLEGGVSDVFLVDIDKDVVEVSKKYLPRISHDSFEHPNASVVIDDANVFLDESQGECFDAVIYDLTMHPEALTNRDRVDFLSSIFLKISKALKPNGLVTMQCCAELDRETIDILKPILQKLFISHKFKTVFIPSFCENWIFASVTNSPV